MSDGETGLAGMNSTAIGVAEDQRHAETSREEGKQQSDRTLIQCDTITNGGDSVISAKIHLHLSEGCCSKARPSSGVVI